MFGAILGDMIGAPFEFDRGKKTKDFPMFSRESRFTDDTVMTIAVAEALMDSRGLSEEETKQALVDSMRKWGRKYPHAGYGGRFRHWLWAEDPQPYGSFGNGSAMRVAAAGWLYDTLEETQEKARWTAEVTHNHPEGIKGAEATACAIFLARTGKSKQEIKDCIIGEFGYNLNRTCDEIRPTYRHVESCQETVPEAITAFLEGRRHPDRGVPGRRLRYPNLHRRQHGGSHVRCSRRTQKRMQKPTSGRSVESTGPIHRQGPRRSAPPVKKGGNF